MKMFRWIWIWLNWISALGLYAQTPDTAYINTENRKAFQLHDTAPDTARIMSSSVLAICRNNGYLPGRADAAITLGAIARNADDLPLSFQYFREALHCRQMLGDSNRVAAVFINLGINHFQESVYDSAIACVYYATHLLENTAQKEYKLLGSAYLLLSNIFDEYNEPQEAMRYAHKSLEAYTTTNKNDNIARAAYALGNRYKSGFQLDSALLYYRQAYNNFRLSANASVYMPEICTCLATVFTEKRDYRSAEIYFREAWEYLEKDAAGIDLFHWFLNKGYWFDIQGQHAAAIQMYRAANAAGEAALNFNDQNYLYDNMADCFASLKMVDSAFYYKSLAYNVRDSIFEENKRKAFTRYQTQQYKNEAALEQIKSQRQAAKTRLFLLLTLGLLSFVAFLGWVLIQRKRSFALISRQREMLHRQAVDELLKSSEIKLLNAGIESNEQARETIAQEIHDRLGSAMVTLSWQYDAILEQFPPGSDARKQMEKLNEALKLVYQDIRHVAHQIGSGVLERVGLMPVLEELCADIRATRRMEVDFSCYGLEQRLSFFQELNLLRIIQELISNTLKYANATQLSLEINKIENELVVMLSDNGAGMDPSVAKGAGLIHLENRVRSMKGTYQINTGPGIGTTVVLYIPLFTTPVNEQIA